MKHGRHSWLVLVLFVGLFGLAYATSDILKPGVEKIQSPTQARPQILPYFPGQVVVKNFQWNHWSTLAKDIPNLEIKLQFGPDLQYSLLSFDREFPVSQALVRLQKKCTWAEPHFYRQLFQNKKKKKGAKKGKKGTKKGKKGAKKGKKRKGTKSHRAVRPPRDALFRLQWGAKNFGQDAPRGLVGRIGADINILRAWRVATGSKKVIIAVLDTGVDYKHPDLEENIWVNEKEKYGIPGYDDDGNGYVDDVHGWDFTSTNKTGNQAGVPNGMDDNGHGTHCAGVIGARVDNLKGVAGINHNVSIMCLKFLNSMGSGGSVGAYRGMRYGSDNGARVISCSFGSSRKSRLEGDAVKYAQRKGVIICAAAGNSAVSNDRTPHYPSNYKNNNVISVAATNNLDKLAGFSCFGATTVHVAAPGVSIVSTLPGNSYGAASGTSMACPMVSGLIGLLLSKNPKMTPVQVRERVMATSDPKVDLIGRVVSWGRVNAYNLLVNKRPKRRSFDLKRMEVEKYKLESIHYPTRRIDHLYKIVRPGAHYIRVHFKRILTDPNWDYVEILDKHNRKVDSITEYLSNSWSAWVKGDTIKIRLYAEPPFSFQTREMGGMTFVTLGKGKASKTWGFEIDRVAYIPKGKGKKGTKKGTKKGAKKGSKKGGKKK